jgi:hypothetical protein
MVDISHPETKYDVEVDFVVFETAVDDGNTQHTRMHDFDDLGGENLQKPT